MSKSVVRPDLNVYQQGGSVIITTPPTDPDADPSTATQITIGQQPDGSYGVTTLNAPAPLVPSTPIVVPSSLGLVVTWDGLLSGDTTGSKLNANSDFETGVDPWTAGNGVLVQSSVHAHMGTYSGQMTLASDDYTTSAVNSESIPVTAGSTYKVTGYFWLTTAVTLGFSLSVSWYDADGGYLSTSSTATSLTAAAWEHVSNTFTAPTGAFTAVVVPTLSAGSGDDGGVTSDDPFYVDDISFSQVALNTPADFDHVAVHVSTTSGFTPSPATLVGTLRKAGNFPITPLDSDTTYYVLFVGVNTSGVAGDASEQASGVPSAVVATSIADGIVTTLKLADDAVTAAKIAAGAVGTAEIAGQAVDLSKLADGSVNAQKLVNGAVGSTQLADNAVQAAKLASGSVSASKLVSGAVGSDALAANAVVAGKVAANAIGTDALTANAVTAGKIAADTITASNIAAGAIGASELAANSVVAGKIAANAVNTSQLVAGSVQASTIAAGAVDTAQLAADAVTTDKLEALAVTAAKIAANTITAGNIATGAITADKLAATLVLASQIIAGQTDGARVQIDSTGIAAYNSENTNTVAINSDGTAMFNGDLVQANNMNVSNQLSMSGGPLIFYAVGSPLNTNSDLTSGTTGWTADGSCTIASNATHQFNGHNTMQVGRSVARVQRGVISSTVVVTAGLSYSAQAWVYNDASTATPAPLYISISWRDFNNVTFARTTGSPNATMNSYFQLSIDGVAPAGATQAVVHILNSAPGASGTGDFWVGYGALMSTSGIAMSLASQSGTDPNGFTYPQGVQVDHNLQVGGFLTAANLDADAITVTLSTAGTSHRTHHVTFNKTFADVPIVAISGDGTRPATLVNVTNETTTGFDFTAVDNTGADVTNDPIKVKWIAYLP